jgi:hypothetical protein
MDTGVWRDVSLIFLIIQAMLLSLVPLAIVGGMVYGMRRLYAVLPGLFARVRAIMAIAHMWIEQVSTTVAAPIISVYALAARLSAWKRYIVKELKR